MSESIGLDIPVSDFNKICRVCLARCEKLTLIHKIVFTYGHSLEGTVEKLLLTGVLERYSDVKVRRNDAKPQNICEKCLNLLANAFNVLSLFRLSDSRLDKILKRDSFTTVKKSQSNNGIRDRNKSSIGTISHRIYRNNALQDLKLQESKMHFEIDLSKEDSENLDTFTGEDDSITILESPRAKDSVNTSYENRLTEDKVKNHTADQFNNWRKWDHTYCVKPAKYSYTVRLQIGKNKPRKPRIRLKSKQVLSEKQLKKMLLQYQHENEIFSCKFCEGQTFQGMDKVIDHMNTIHSSTDNCILCAKKFSKNRMLPHVASHAKKRNLICYKCSLYFKDKESLEAHYGSEDHKNFTLKCHICGKGFGRLFRLKVHIQEVHLNKGQQRTQCPKCGLILKYKGNLGKHLHTHKEMKERKSFLCEQCAQSFTTLAALKRHVLITHEGQVHLRQQYQKRSIKPVEHDPRFYKPDEKVYACDYCPRTISTKEAFFKHRISHPECTDVVCSICGMTLPSPVEYRQHREAAHSNFRCEICHKGWPTKAALSMHKSQAHRPRRYKCPSCPKSFRTPQMLKCHKVTHTTERPFSCQFCDKKYKQSAQVTQHILCVHSEKRRYKCNICSKSFIFNYSLKAHIRNHMGYRPFSCPYCSKCFADTVSRHKHVKRYHPNQLNDFLAFKKQHQSDEIRLAEGLYTGTEDRENEDYLAVLSLANENNVTSGNENNEQSSKNAETVINEFVFVPGGGSTLNSLLERT